MQRTKANGLLYKTLRRDASFTRTGMAEYVEVFRKWSTTDEERDRETPVVHEREMFPLDWWQKAASPVWWDIEQTRVLNVRIARGDQDEKHICPLQLDVIERAVALWSNPGDVVASPFTGIGSEGVVALRMGRRFVGAELKPEYFRFAVENLESATVQADLFDLRVPT
jgi:DNA modification methylase